MCPGVVEPEFSPGVRLCCGSSPLAIGSTWHWAPSRATEIDYALILDLATHIGISQGRIGRAARAIAAWEASLGRALTPAERRQALGESLANEIPTTEFRRHRRVRNITY